MTGDSFEETNRDIRDGSQETITQQLEAFQQHAGARWIVVAGCEIVFKIAL